MVTMEARKEVLDLVAAGKISAAEAADLLSGKASLEQAPEPDANVAAEAVAENPLTEAEVPAAEKPVAGAAPSWLKVRVSDLSTGKNRVKVNIPLRVVRLGMRLGAGFVPETQRVDWDELQRLIAEGGVGMLVDVQDAASGEHVEVYVE